MTQASDESDYRKVIIRSYIQYVEAKLNEAAALARSANTLDAAGLADRAFQTLLDAEPLIHDANMLLNAASIVHRHERGDPPFR